MFGDEAIELKLDDVTLSNLGRVGEVVVTKDDTLLMKGRGGGVEGKEAMEGGRRGGRGEERREEDKRGGGRKERGRSGRGGSCRCSYILSTSSLQAREMRRPLQRESSRSRVRSRRPSLTTRERNWRRDWPSSPMG